MGDSSGGSEPVAALLDNRLVMVTGKGGTGKTAFAASLALLAAAKGKRVLLAELDSQRPALTPIFDEEPVFEPATIRAGLSIANLTWPDALRAFLANLVPSRRIVRLILSNRMVARFLDFTPGSQEIVLLSALGERVEDFDLVVADLPASGHAFSLLDITRSAMGLFRSGPVRGRAEELRAMLTADSTRMVLVALPEEMVVNETLETFERLDRYALLSQPPVVFLNRATTPTFTAEERELMTRLEGETLTSAQEEFLRAGRWEAELEQATADSIERLTEALPEAPVMVSPAPPGEGARAVVEHVAATLGRRIGVSRRQIAWETS